jgi:Patatin-like phospholipase
VARTALAKGPTEFAATVVVGATVVWMIFAGSFAHLGNFLIDLAAAVLAWLATLLIMRWWTRRLDPAATSWKAVAPKQLENADAVVWGLLAWLFVSLLSVVVARPLPVDGGRFAGLGPQRAIVPASAERFKDLRVGLALSGGGFRAAVFHAGVLEALEDLGIRVDNLSTVSGGSIIGAYYAVGGEPKAFAEAVAEGRFDLKRELMLIHNALRLPLPMRLPGVGVALLPFCSFDRLDVQSALLERRLFDHAKLGAGLSGNEPQLGQPELMIAVTDLTYGFQIGLLPDGILKLGDGVGSWEVYRGAAFESSRRLTLAERVAISGAFPLAFPPTPLEIRVRPLDSLPTPNSTSRTTRLRGRSSTESGRQALTPPATRSPFSAVSSTSCRRRPKPRPARISMPSSSWWRATKHTVGSGPWGCARRPRTRPARPPPTPPPSRSRDRLESAQPRA